MVVLLDLDLDHDSDDEDSGHQLGIALQQQLRGLQDLKIRQPVLYHSVGHGQVSVSVSDRPPNTKGAGLLASALACYPVALSLSSYLDLNDLFALSSTCHDVHDHLIQFAHHLRSESLRCVNDRIPHLASRAGGTERETNNHEYTSEEQGSINRSGYSTADLGPSEPPTHRYHGSNSSVIGLTGKIGECARDLVSPCRKCGVVICRNCAVKPPTVRCLPERYRRLCRTCLEAPLSDHLERLSETSECHDSPQPSKASSARSARSWSAGSALSQNRTEAAHTNAAVFTAPAFLRTPCECDSRGVYLCQPCGQNLCAANTTYKRVWTWRSRYSTHIGGGLGTGLGQGEQGQKCGRGNHCLEKGAAGVCWMEIDCSEARAGDGHAHEYFGNSQSSISMTADLESDLSRTKPGYFSQEMEGIGGVVKKKVRKRVKVGATVYEFDDERESGQYLMRESSGQARGWCGWCFRVCPGRADLPLMDQMMYRQG